MVNVSNVYAYVSQVTHAIEMEIDGSGTVASALTVMVFEGRNRDGKAYRISIDFFVKKPLILFVYHVVSGI